MKTTIDNNSRVYQVKTSIGKQAFCNIEQLNEVIKDLQAQPGYFKIFHFWNNKAEKVTKKDLKGFFEGSNLKQEFIY